MNRIMKVARMQLMSRWTYLGIPAVIIGGSFLLSLAIWALIPDEVGTKYSGAGQAVMWYFFGLGIQSLTYTFPFSQGMSVSRRRYFLGTVGLFAAIAAAISILYVVLGKVEVATNGWGVQGRMFALDWVADRNWFEQLFFYFILMMFLFLLGFWGATIFKRWQTTGVMIASFSVAALLLAFVALVTWQGWWVAIGSWMISLTPMLVGLLVLALVALLGGGSYLTLRRATP